MNLNVFHIPGVVIGIDINLCIHYYHIACFQRGIRIIKTPTQFSSHIAHIFVKYVNDAIKTITLYILKSFQSDGHANFISILFRIISYISNCRLFYFKATFHRNIFIGIISFLKVDNSLRESLYLEIE